MGTRSLIILSALLIVIGALAERSCPEILVKGAVYPKVPVDRQSGNVVNLNTTFEYETIQDAIDAIDTLDNHVIFITNGSYYEHVVVDKSVRLVGEDIYSTILDGNGSGTVILTIADEVVISRLTVRNGGSGIYTLGTRNCVVEGTYVTGNKDRGILFSRSNGGRIRGNIVENTSPGYGINANDSQAIKIEDNIVQGNVYDGIGLTSSNSCVVRGNTISSNQVYGIWIDFSNSNAIYHNNIVSNGIQATSNSADNLWNNEIEGNYWSDYVGTDLNHDGIGDSPYTALDIRDEYPLMGMFSSFTTNQGKHVKVISNSTIEAAEYFESNSTIKLQVTNITETQHFGFCRVAIPHALMDMENLSVIIDGGSLQTINFNLNTYDNGTHRWIYFAHEHSPHMIDIIYEFHLEFILPIALVGLLTATIVFRRIHGDQY